MQGNVLYCQLNNNLLESFNSHQSVLDIQYTSVPSFPSAWLQSHCWELAWLLYSTDGNSLCSLHSDPIVSLLCEGLEI